LVPFVPGRLSFGGLGVRFGAFLVDYALLYLLGVSVGFLIPVLLGLPMIDAHMPPSRLALQLGAGVLLWVLYFGGSEAAWGCTPGKRWLGLRVTSMAAAERPRTFRVLLRVVVFLLLINLGFYASQILL